MSEPQTLHVAYVAMCTGLHVVPAVPSIPGIEHVGASSSTKDEKRAFHSVEYKRRDQLKGRRVMILGTGETGMDIAYESAKAGAKEVVLCSRAGYVQPSSTIEIIDAPLASSHSPRRWCVSPSTS